MIASDINNPEFQGAVANPDSRLSVKFYSRPIQNMFKTEQEGRPIFEDAVFVRITLPGDTNNIIDTFANEDHKRRFPMHWAHYQNTKGGDASVIGTPLTEWPLVTAAQAEELKALKFYTVEQVANASDAQLQKIGMLAGMSQHAFRDRAQRYLQVAKDEADVSKSEDRVKQLEAENAKLKEETARQMAEMEARMAALADAVAERRKPGPKPKEKQEPITE